VRAAALVEENEVLLAERDRIRAELAKETKTRKRQAEELASHRKRVDKANRRSAKMVEQPLGTTARIKDHEARAVQAERERDRLVTERDRLTTERDTLTSAVSRLESELQERNRVAAPPGTEHLLESEQAAALARAEAELSRSREGFAKREEELAHAREAEARLRKRMGNQEQLYASVRAELEVKKDRIRTQEEQLLRFQSLEAAVRDDG
jgi:chromosome segregation protein